MNLEFQIPRHMRGVYSKALADATDRSDIGMAGCPFCSCGAVEDWEGVAHLRCTGCHRALNAPGTRKVFAVIDGGKT